MTQAKPRFSSFEEYLLYSNETDNRYELIDGALVELPPESGLHDLIANFLFLKLVEAGIPLPLVRPGKCEIQVPVLQAGDAQNRYPDLVVLREEHIALTQTRLTIRLDMPPPQFVAEVVSPGQTSRTRDYVRKRAQYSKIGIPEYWIIDPQLQMILVLTLIGEVYVEHGTFRGAEASSFAVPRGIVSPTFPTLILTVNQVLTVS